ncbi:hypothetical protein [Methylobacterium sp. Gmos1]
MDLKSAEAQATTLASQAAKGGLHFVWTWTAAHARTATVVALAAIVAAFVAGIAVGVR